MIIFFYRKEYITLILLFGLSFEKREKRLSSSSVIYQTCLMKLLFFL